MISAALISSTWRIATENFRGERSPRELLQILYALKGPVAD
ncbi:MAG: hypothetical protein ABL996_02270 [Micropepsaceae bacterium]